MLATNICHQLIPKLQSHVTWKWKPRKNIWRNDIIKDAAIWGLVPFSGPVWRHLTVGQMKGQTPPSLWPGDGSPWPVCSRNIVNAATRTPSLYQGNNSHSAAHRCSLDIKIRHPASKSIKLSTLILWLQGIITIVYCDYWSLCHV